MVCDASSDDRRDQPESLRRYREALARGEIVPPLDMEALLDMIYGPILFRLLVGPALAGVRRCDGQDRIAAVAPPRA
jgi:hypothetical protein